MMKKLLKITEIATKLASVYVGQGKQGNKNADSNEIF